MSLKIKSIGSISLRLIKLFGLIIILAGLITACQPAEPTQEDAIADEPAPTPLPPTPTPLPDQSMIIQAWESGAHSLYDLGHGPNTWCARCHSPQNWDPAAFRGPPPSCFSCKFPTDEEVRIAEGNPLVLEEDWVSISCDTCHVVDKNGIASEEIAWLNPVKMEYIDVSTPTELCEKCHVTTTGNSFGSAVDHKITLGGSAHLNYGGFLGEEPPPQYCSDCHDPHDLKPKECEECHDVANLDTHMKGKNAFHDDVTCMACHDANGYDVGPHPDESMGGIWVTQETTMGRGGPSTAFKLSHSIVYEVACDRCHFENNTWELRELTADGETPMVDICVNGESLSVEKPDLGEYGEVDKDFTLGKCPES